LSIGAGLISYIAAASGRKVQWHWQYFWSNRFFFASCYNPDATVSY
jgi:hypothetical protein